MKYVQNSQNFSDYPRATSQTRAAKTNYWSKRFGNYSAGSRSNTRKAYNLKKAARRQATKGEATDRFQSSIERGWRATNILFLMRIKNQPLSVVSSWCLTLFNQAATLWQDVKEKNPERQINYARGESSKTGTSLVALSSLAQAARFGQGDFIMPKTAPLGVTLAWLEKLEFVSVVTKTGRIYQALQATLRVDEKRKIVIKTPNHPNAIRGLLIELGCSDFTKTLAQEQLQALCGTAFFVNSVWILERQDIQAMKRASA
jgi:hypothetical protein